MRLLLVPLEDSVVFPEMTATIAAEIPDGEDRVLLLPRHEGTFARVGTVAEVVDRSLSRRGTAAVVTGLRRGIPGAAVPSPDGALRVEVEPVHDGEPADERTRQLEREYRAVVEEILELRGDDGRVAAFLRSVGEPGALADTTGYSPDVSIEDKRALLETIDVTERLERAVQLQRERLAELQVRQRIRDDVETGAQQQQREYFLRKQMESIRKELGEDEGSIAEEYAKKIEESDMPDEVREQAQREL